MNELIRSCDNGYSLDLETSKKIAEFERELKRIKEAEDKLKEAILHEMESKGIVKVTTEDLTISYVAATTRESLDSKALKEELPDIYDAYVKLSPVKASLRWKVGN